MAFSHVNSVRRADGEYCRAGLRLSYSSLKPGDPGCSPRLGGYAETYLSEPPGFEDVQAERAALELRIHT